MLLPETCYIFTFSDREHPWIHWTGSLKHSKSRAVVEECRQIRLNAIQIRDIFHSLIIQAL